MPDYTSFLHPPVAATKPQPPLPIEIYPGVIKSYEFREHPNTRNPMCRFQVGLLGWPLSIPDSKKSFTYDDGTEVEIYPEKRLLVNDFYLTENAIYRIVQFLEALGINIPVVNGKLDLETAIPKAVGERVGADVRQYINQRTGLVGNNIDNLIPMRGPLDDERPDDERPDA